MSDTQKTKEITIICREYDKYSGGKTAVYIVARNATGQDIDRLSLRSRVNPELTYYATAIKGDDDFVVALAKAKLFRKPYFEKI